MFAITYRVIFLYIAAVLVVVSGLLIGTLGLPFGIDFTGGSLTEVAYPSTMPAQPEIEAIVSTEVSAGFSVRAATDEAGRPAYMIRTPDLSDTQRATLTEALTALADDSEITRFTTIGPVIGQELRDKAVWAIGGVVLIIILYVAFAFAGIGTPVSSWMYGGITIVVLAHDVLIPTALMSVLGYIAGAEIDVLFVMALLAILGYSVNDTIVVFDRVREKLVANRTEQKTSVTEVGGLVRETVTYTLHRPYAELVGEAVQETLARSINTSLTTSLALVALYFIGGSVTQTFALILLAGVLAGTYSSICIASPLLVAYAKWRNHA